MKVRSVSCPYCSIQMKYKGVNFENLAKSVQPTECTVPFMIYVEYYECPQCGKIELFHDRRNMKSRDGEPEEETAPAAAVPAEEPAVPAKEKRSAAKPKAKSSSKKTVSEDTKKKKSDKK